MTDIKLMEVNGRPRQVEISPAFIQIIEEVDSVYINARSKIITNILDNSMKGKEIYKVRETPNEISEEMKALGIKMIELMSVNGRPKRIIMRNSAITKVEYYNNPYLYNAHSKVYTNLTDNNGKTIEYIASETKEEIEQKLQ
ncbi:MAG: hypothetical protein HFJ42_01275 [Clostridia bacterium]|nr:hypothetical protein [Clostridia bacterium]